MDIESKVKETYGNLARHNSPCCDNSEMSSFTSLVPSYGCAINYMEHIALRRGDSVIDLGSGLGKDAFMAAKIVGEAGRVYGIDFTDEMIEGARKNAEKLGLSNVKFLKGNIKKIPLDDGVADVVISNCVINLVDNKEAVFREAFRVLKKGGRLVVSDMISHLEESGKNQLTTSDLCGCIGGATSIDEYNSALRSSGFTNIESIEQYKSEYKAELIKVPYSSVLFRATKP